MTKGFYTWSRPFHVYVNILCFPTLSSQELNGRHFDLLSAEPYPIQPYVAGLNKHSKMAARRKQQADCFTKLNVWSQCHLASFVAHCLSKFSVFSHFLPLPFLHCKWYFTLTQCTFIHTHVGGWWDLKWPGLVWLVVSKNTNVLF